MKIVIWCRTFGLKSAVHQRCTHPETTKVWKVMLRKMYFVDSSELATTAPAMTARRTVRWMKWTIGTNRTIPFPGWDITWQPADGGVKMTRGAGENNHARRWWRRLRGLKGGSNPILNCCSPTCTRRWYPAWTSRESPCGDMCSSTKSTTH